MTCFSCRDIYLTKYLLTTYLLQYYMIMMLSKLQSEILEKVTVSGLARIRETDNIASYALLWIQIRYLIDHGTPNRSEQVKKLFQ